MISWKLTLGIVMLIASMFSLTIVEMSGFSLSVMDHDFAPWLVTSFLSSVSWLLIITGVLGGFGGGAKKGILSRIGGLF